MNLPAFAFTTDRVSKETSFWEKEYVFVSLSSNTRMTMSVFRWFTVSRIFVGRIRQFSTVSKATLCAVTTTENRTTAISYMYVARSIAFSGGAALGGLLAEKYGIRTVIFLACWAFTFNIIFIHFIMKDIDNDAANIDEEDKKKDLSVQKRTQSKFSDIRGMLATMSIYSVMTAASSSIHRIVNLPPEIRQLMVRDMSSGCYCTNTPGLLHNFTEILLLPTSILIVFDFLTFA